MDAFLENLSEGQLRVIKTAIYPQRWQEFEDKYDLDWHYTKFEPGSYTKVATSPGVYCFHIGHAHNNIPPMGQSLYGGITTRTLRIRCREYLVEKDNDEGRIYVRKFLKVFEGELDFAWAIVDPKVYDLRQLEKDMNGAMMPPYSRKDFDAKVRGERAAWQ